MALPTSRLGRTGFDATRLGFGAMELAGFEGTAPEDAGRLLHQVLDAGINLIDTSPDYGSSEELIGEHLSGRRHEFFLASKCGCIVGRPPRPREGGGLEHIFTPENIRAGVEQSLTRMRTDHLDLVQVHASPSRKVLEENGSIEAMGELRREGKVRFIGMSGVLPDLTDHIAMDVFDAFQIPYSALQPEHDDAVQAAAGAGAGTIIRGGVARGSPAPDHDLEGSHPYWRTFSRDRRDLWERARLDELLDGMGRMEFLLRFVLSHPDLHTTIVGTRNPDHLAANVAAARKGPLPPHVRAEAQRRVREAQA